MKAHISLLLVILVVGCERFTISDISHPKGDCFKSPDPSDEVFHVIRWHFHAKLKDPNDPNGKAQNWFTFQYTPKSDTPCENPISMEVCDHDVASATTLTNCLYLTKTEKVTRIVVRANSIRQPRSSHPDCACP